MGIKSQSMDLSIMAMEAGQFETGAVQIVSHDATISDGRGNDRIVVPVRPLHITHSQLVLVAGRGSTGEVVGEGVTDNGIAKVEFLGRMIRRDADRLEDLFTTDNSMSPLGRDIQSGDRRTSLMGDGLGSTWSIDRYGDVSQPRRSSASSATILRRHSSQSVG